VMTCNAEFYEDDDFSKNVVVDNFYGDSFSVADAGTNKRWNAMGTDSAEVTQWFVRDYASIIPNSYKTEYVGRFKSGRKTM